MTPRSMLSALPFGRQPSRALHLAEGIAADYDAEGQLAGIEILDAVKRFGGQETLRQVVIEGIGLGMQLPIVFLLRRAIE